MSSDNWREVIELVYRQDPAAFARLRDRYHARLVQALANSLVARGLDGDLESYCKSAANYAMYKIMTDPPILRELPTNPDPLFAYLFTTASNKFKLYRNDHQSRRLRRWSQETAHRFRLGFEEILARFIKGECDERAVVTYVSKWCAPGTELHCFRQLLDKYDTVQIGKWVLLEEAISLVKRSFFLEEQYNPRLGPHNPADSDDAEQQMEDKVWRGENSLKELMLTMRENFDSELLRLLELAKLSKSEEDVLILHKAMGYSHEEIVELMKAEKKSVENWSVRAMNKIKKVARDSGLALPSWMQDD